MENSGKENPKGEEDSQEMKPVERDFQRERISRGKKQKRKRFQIRSRLEIILHICQLGDY